MRSIAPTPVAAGYALELVGVTKRYEGSARDVDALRGVSLAIARRQFVAITGPSGSGKSTLLNLMAGLDAPTHGDVSVDGRSLATMSDAELMTLRRTRVAVVFQFFNLLPAVDALENVALPLRAAGGGRRETEERARAALEAVGLGARAAHFPDQLSGGEMQRVAIARALVIEPTIVLADEPTGNLDSKAGQNVLEILRHCHAARNATVVLVTHSDAAAACAERRVHLEDGLVVADDGASVLARENP